MGKEGSLVVISGGNRGLGRAIATTCAPFCKVMVLVCRSSEGLSETENSVKALNPETKIFRFSSVDFSEPNKEKYREIFEQCLTENEGITEAMIFHNAGNIGRQGQTMDKDCFELSEFHNYFNVNLFSAQFFNAAFLTAVRAKLPTLEEKKKIFVINISSLCALKPFYSWGYYCTGKAARDMMFKVMAEENPNLRILSYAPGPLETNMVYDVLKDPDTADYIQGLFKDCSRLNPSDSAAKMLSILNKNEFKSGDHIDYFD